MALGDALGTTDVAYITPSAEPKLVSVLAPRSDRADEPYLTNAVSTLDGVIKDLEARGASSERIFMIGFSHGACLALEYVAGNARRYGGAAGLSGGLIGPDITPRGVIEFDSPHLFVLVGVCGG